MIRVFLLLFFIVSSCQQKKRGVVCDRVDANSGQCVQQLNKVVADASPLPSIDQPPILPPPIEATDKDDKIEAKEITDKTLLKDIVINSKCLAGDCWPWDRPNPAKGEPDINLICKAGCSSDSLVDLKEENGLLQDTARLCREGDKNVADGKTLLTCGIADVDNLDFQDATIPMPITVELLKQRVCIDHTSYSGGEQVSRNEGCTIPLKLSTYYTTTQIIELTFSLLP